MADDFAEAGKIVEAETSIDFSDKRGCRKLTFVGEKGSKNGIYRQGKRTDRSL